MAPHGSYQTNPEDNCRTTGLVFPVTQSHEKRDHATLKETSVTLIKA